MLKVLEIENIAVIEKAAVQFDTGLNVLTGETGAGKSIVVDAINTLDTFLLTMAMTALGAESSFEKFKKAGARPFLLAGLLYVWLFFGGYWLVKLISF